MEGSIQRSAGDDPAVATLDRFISEQSVDTSRPNWKSELPKPPCASFSVDTQYFWRLETNQGEIVIRLMPDVAPMHVSSTIYLTLLGFYDGLAFHRVISGFMAQGGCPRGTGTGGPGYQYDGEFDSAVRHDRPGLLSMANAGPRTDGSQFFLTFVPTPWLDGKHTIFGEVVEGTGTLRALESRGSQSGRTSEPLEIRHATIQVG
jgi:peptidyl-prolyl cis-trans isomerase B (cyclophilin B)